MQSARSFGPFQRFAQSAITLAVVLLPAGCGMPGAPQPPSLHLPARVNDLAATRAGGQVALRWTMPRQDTDKEPLKGRVAVRICRMESSASSACATAATLAFAPGADAAYADTLPPSLATGAPRRLTYAVELDNRKGRSAGLSKGATVLAGAAPAAVDGLTAWMRRDGILLQWTAAPISQPPTAVRLVRTLAVAPPAEPASSHVQSGPFTPPSAPREISLLVAPAPHLDRALDSHIEFGATYVYRAQRVARVPVHDQPFELAGPLSAPVRIAAVNTLPPHGPTGLAAVATPGVEDAGPAIDLNWQPNTEADLAGYIVYRREAGVANDWRRISPAQPVAAPAFHDADVLPGHRYRYAVSAVDQQGHESARSAEAEETVPAP